MERSGGGRENEGILYAMHIEKQFDCNGIASLAVKKKKQSKEKCTEMQAPNSVLVHISATLSRLWK